MKYFGQFDRDNKALILNPKANKHDRAGSKHPSVKPITLMQHIVRMYTPPGGTVLDPFAGSGTTAEAARLEDNNCILIERDDEYVDDMLTRFGDTIEHVTYAEFEAPVDSSLEGLL